MKLHSAQFAPFVERMQAEKLPDVFIDNFAYYYEKLIAGDDGLIAEADLAPVGELADADGLSPHLEAVGRAAVARTIIIKLNGGLGTGMGLVGPKSLLTVKNELTFLDIIARQAVGVGAPLLLMNSFATDEESLAVLAHYPALGDRLPLSFRQHKQPKVSVATLEPASWPEEKELEWCPPGHGDLYVALVTSGMLDRLLAAGYEYAFISNADNLGAVLDLSILGHFIDSRLPFLMEVADRTPADRKGGHLARLNDGRLVLREIAQCPDEDMAAFQDIERHRYFNTNNLWLHLPTLQQVLLERDFRLGLPMIRNRKTIDPRDPNSTPVYQLETAMGSAIAVFDGAAAIRVPRARFAPVKRTDDLLAVRSDAYVLTEDYRIVLAPERQGAPPTVVLDNAYYRFVSDLDHHFPGGAPSLRCCHCLRIEGEFEFGREIVVRGDVLLRNPGGECLIVPDKLILEDECWPEEALAAGQELEAHAL
jgi:UTP--glucose-1-phosphate uridylyltransferase